MATEPRPHWMAPNRSRVSTFITCEKAEEVVAFARAVFGVRDVRPPLYRESGALWNAELLIGDSTIMLGAAQGEMARPAFLYVHVPDLEETFDRARAAGAEVVMEPQEQFYGDVDGGVADMAGNWWWISTHKETLDADEIERRARQQEAGA